MKTHIMPAHRTLPRQLFLSCALVILLPILPSSLFASQSTLPSPQFLDDFVLPTGLAIHGTGFGGISDLSYDAERNRFLAISDDRVQHGPARYYELAIGIESGRITALDIIATHELRAPGGGKFALKGVDPEGIAFDPVGQRIFWSSERDASDIPAIYVAAPDGAQAQALPLPKAYLPARDGKRGVYRNLGFEGLDLTPDARWLYAATENGLMQDGSKATLEHGSPARILKINTTTLQPEAEYIYMTEAIPKAPLTENGWRDNGLSGLTVLPDGSLLAIERSFAAGVGFTIQLFHVCLEKATNINGQEEVALESITPARKSLWFTIEEGIFPLTAKVDNIESIAFGPVVDGAQTMLLVSDNNFNDAETTHFLLFAVELPQPPAHLEEKSEYPVFE